MDKSGNNRLAYFIQKPRLVFLLDAFGASISATILMLVFWKFNARLGLPLDVIQLLAFLASCLSLFSFSCYFFLKNFRKRCLKVIVLGNSLYSLLTACLVISFYSKLSALELIYFSLEVTLICGIIYLELQTLNLISKGLVTE